MAGFALAVGSGGKTIEGRIDFAQQGSDVRAFRRQRNGSLKAVLSLLQLAEQEIHFGGHHRSTPIPLRNYFYVILRAGRRIKRFPLRLGWSPRSATLDASRFWLCDVGAEGQQAAVAIPDYELAGAPWHVGEGTRELNAFGPILGVERVGVFDVDVGVQQLFFVFLGIGQRRLGAAKVNGMAVARHN